jgi:membrane associated rhomboid family serine protease
MLPNKAIIIAFTITIILLLGLIPGWPSWAYLNPRHGNILSGIVLFPLLHQNLSHLSGNLAFLIPCALLIYKLEPRSYLRVFVLIYISHGVILWFLGREGFHLGSSGFALGLGFYVLSSALISLNTQLFFGGAILFLIHFSVFSNFMVSGAGIGDDAHICGVVSGFLVAIYQQQGK